MARKKNSRIHKSIAIFLALLMLGTTVLVPLTAYAALSAPVIYQPNELPQEKEFDIYLCIGQSNMAGRAAIEAQDQFAIPNTLLFNGTNWETAQANYLDPQYGLNRYNNVGDGNGRLNPAMYFADFMQANSDGRTVGIISNAKGNSAIREWVKGTGFYSNTVSRVRSALAQGGRLRGIIWHQGENDIYETGDLRYYLPTLNKLVDDLRADFGVTAAECPFIAGEIQYDELNGGRNSSLFNDLLKNFVSTTRNTDFISAEDPNNPGYGLPGRPGDLVHFDSYSQRILGARYGEKMVEMQAAHPEVEDVDAGSASVVINNSNLVYGGAITIRVAAAGTYTVSGVSDINPATVFDAASDVVLLDKITSDRSVLIEGAAGSPAIKIKLNGIHLVSNAPIRLDGYAKVEFDVYGNSTVNAVHATMTSAYAGITVPYDAEATFTSACQGSITAQGAVYNVSRSEATMGAGIGGAANITGSKCGTMTFGGNVIINATTSATSGNVGAAAIGGAGYTSGAPQSGTLKDIVITDDASINAASYDYGAAIGSGYGRNNSAMSLCVGGIIEIGGNAKVTATSYSYGAAIGGGVVGTAGEITIKDNAYVRAIAGGASAIGSGVIHDAYSPPKFNADSVITIQDNANVYASSSGLSWDFSSAAIGGGCDASAGTINISGGTIVAIGGYGSPGIGDGRQAEWTIVGAVKGSYGGTINISGGMIISQGGENAPTGLGEAIMLNTAPEALQEKLENPVVINITSGSVLSLDSGAEYSEPIPRPTNGAGLTLYQLAVTTMRSGATAGASAIMFENIPVSITTDGGFTTIAVTGAALGVPFPQGLNALISGKAYVWVPQDDFTGTATLTGIPLMKQGTVIDDDTNDIVFSLLNTSALESKITEAQGKIESKYTAQSWKNANLAAVIASAQSVLANATTQNDIYTSIATLNTAMGKLVLKSVGPEPGVDDGETTEDKYTVTFDSNGGSSIEKQTVEKNAKVKKPSEPQKTGYDFTGWHVDKELTDKYDFDIEVTKTFTLYAGWEKIPTTPGNENPFGDINESDWFYQDVLDVYEKGLMKGVQADEFAPYLGTSRAMIVTMLYRLAGEPDVGQGETFDDVKADEWYTAPIAWAVENGLAKGYGDGLFRPDQTVNRQELAAFIYRYAEFAEKNSPVEIVLDFGDVDNIEAWALESVEWCVGNGIILGRTGNIFDPTATATRAEVAAMLNRFVKVLE